MNRLLVSACLLGEPVRYDGKAKPVGHTGLQALIESGCVVAYCPEVGGGLPVPRPAAEIVGGDGAAVLDGHAAVITASGDDVTGFFVAGAERVLALRREQDIRVAILTEKSPSCGSSLIYDGSHGRRSIPGSGVTTALLRRNGIAVFDQHRIDAALSYLGSCNSRAPRQ